MENDDAKSGIGGWLVLPLLGLLITPLRIAYSLYMDMWPVFSEGYWEVLTTPTSEAYHRFWATLIIFEVTGNLVLILFTLAALWFFLRKSRRAPLMMIIWLGFNLAFTSADFFLSELIPAVAEQSNPESVKELSRSVIGAAIWIPYFLVSKRVKATFVK